MKSKALIDPELVETLEALPAIDFANVELGPLRAAMDQMFAEMPMPEGLPVAVERRLVPGQEGALDVPVIVYTPTTGEGPFPAMIHFHGGGYLIGSAAMNEIVNRMRAASLGCVIVSVDYRLAPETAHPGQVDDGYAVLRHVFRESSALKIDTARVGVIGESAGGGLAAAVAVLARDRGEFAVAFQHLIYPMLDDRTCTREAHPYCGEFVWTPEHNRFAWGAMLGTAPGGDGVSHYAAPARTADLAGLPPTFIAVGALDLFLEEDMEYARRLARAGVPVEFHVYPGSFHGFDMAANATVAQAFAQDSERALKRFLAPAAA